MARKKMKAHLQSRKGKGYRKEIILFNLKQEEYIMWLYESLKNKVSGNTEFKRSEMLLVKAVFPNCSLDYLFETAQVDEEGVVTCQS